MHYSKFSLRRAPHAPAMALAAGFLVGCAATSSPTPTIAYPSVTGNWEFVNSGGIGLPLLRIVNFTGALQSSGGTVTGTLHAFDDSNLLSPCVAQTQDLAATGTLDAAGNLTLNVPISGGTAVITFALTPNSKLPARGNYVINGGACAQPADTAVATQFQPVTGTYSGTVTLTNTTSTSIATAVLTQSASPDADGLFPLSGTITLVGTACNASFTFSGGTVTGNLVNVFHESTYQSPGGDFSASATSQGSSFEADNITVYSGVGCGLLHGALTRQ